MTAHTPLKGCFVIGTDTEVGKTRISAALLHALSQAGFISAGFKPVAAGTQMIGHQWVNEDVRALRDASSLALSDAEVGPFQLKLHAHPTLPPPMSTRPSTAPAYVVPLTHWLRALMCWWSKALAVFVCPWVTTGTAPIWLAT